MSHTAFVDDLNVFSAILVIAVAHDSLLNVYRPVSIEQRLSGWALAVSSSAVTIFNIEIKITIFANNLNGIEIAILFPSCTDDSEARRLADSQQTDMRPRYSLKARQWTIVSND